MFCKNLFSVISLALFVFIGNTAFAACPSTDLTGDCCVDYEDFTEMGGQWLNGYDSNDLTEMAIQWLTTDPCVPDDMTYIPDGEFEMGDHFAEGYSNELPVHVVLVDAFFMSKFEITNSQYCDYLNSAYDANDIKVDGGIVYASSDIGNSYPYCDTHSYSIYGQIDYSGGVFIVITKNGRDMSDDPMAKLSWYGCVTYCNWRSNQEVYDSCYDINDPNWSCDFSKYGYRLPTEAEWEYAARGGLGGKRFPWSDPNISHSKANYYADPSYLYDENLTTGHHPLWSDAYPYTSPVGFFDGTTKYKVDYNWPGIETSYQTTNGANGYGLYDMVGNARERCNDWYDEYYYDVSPLDNPSGPVSGTWHVLRGGSWNSNALYLRVAHRNHPNQYLYYPDHRHNYLGFRIVLKTE